MAKTPTKTLDAHTDTAPAPTDHVHAYRLELLTLVWKCDCGDARTDEAMPTHRTGVLGHFGSPSLLA